MNQIALPLRWPEPADEFLIGPSNARAVEQLERWGDWPVRAALLVGPPRSGKSLLGRLFVANTGGELIDDVHHANEEDLFHAWNRAQADGRPLLIVAPHSPPAWTVALPDLRSRLAATPVLRIGPPDDALMTRLIERALDRRGLFARPDVVTWLATRVERSHQALADAVDLLDQAATAQQRAITVPFARSVLDAASARPSGSTPMCDA